MRLLAIRIFIAVFFFALLVGVLSQVHDYRQTQKQIQLERHNNPTAIERKWIKFFYFINEAGSGIKYTLTGNPKHMRFYPSKAYLDTLKPPIKPIELKKAPAPAVISETIREPIGEHSEH